MNIWIQPGNEDTRGPSYPACARAWEGRAVKARRSATGGPELPAGGSCTVDRQPVPVPVVSPLDVENDILKNCRLARKIFFF